MKENCVPAHPPASYPVQRPRSATPTTYTHAVSYSVRSVALVFNRRSLNMAILIEPAAAVDVPHTPPSHHAPQARQNQSLYMQLNHIYRNVFN